MSLQILATCSIANEQILKNGQPKFEGENIVLADFLKSAFKSLEISYPKFYKMDRLCQLAFVGTEYLLKDIDPTWRDDEVALLFFNKNSSLDSDWRHQQFINNGESVSPAVFVYTLPNILMGEISIRNKWYGENLFILKPEFSFEEWAELASLFFRSNKAKFCLGGWVDVLGEEYELHLFLAKQEEENKEIGE